MQSLIADHAQTKAEYSLLASVAGTMDTMTPADVDNAFRLILEEYRALPD